MSLSYVNDESLIGFPAFRKKMIDHYFWGPSVLKLTTLTEEVYEKLGLLLGGNVAAEILLLIATKDCGDDDQQWEILIKTGIPWQIKAWKGLESLQQLFNRTVERKKPAESITSSSSSEQGPVDSSLSRPEDSIFIYVDKSTHRHCKKL